MKTKLFFVALTMIVGFSAQAVPSYPRTLSCTLNNGTVISLYSNNGLWAHYPLQNHFVSLTITNPYLGPDSMPALAVNNKATHTRGVADGFRKYVFGNTGSSPAFVELEFHTPYGVVTGIKTFVVEKDLLKFNANKDSKCTITHHDPIEI